MGFFDFVGDVVGGAVDIAGNVVGGAVDIAGSVVGGAKQSFETDVEFSAIAIEQFLDLFQEPFLGPGLE